MHFAWVCVLTLSLVEVGTFPTAELLFGGNKPSPGE
jgi:hypothetical protein